MSGNEIEATSVNMFDWGMIVALHRDKLNQFMLQVYIQRYKSSESLPPVSGVLDAAGGEWRYKIESFLMDKPRMSFEATDLNDSRANMLMRVIGGNQINEKFMNGQWYAQSIEYFSPAQGPALRFNLKLTDTPLIVGADDSVYIDLKDSDDFILEFAESEHDQLIGGDFFKILFNKLDPEQRRYPVGNLAGEQDLDASLKPRSAILRTQKKSKASGDSEGAVLLFIQLGEELRGVLPSGEELSYLLDGPQEARVLVNRDSAMLLLAKDSISKTYRATLDSVDRDAKGRISKLNMITQGFDFQYTGGFFFKDRFTWAETHAVVGAGRPSAHGGQKMDVTLDATGLTITGLKVDSEFEMYRINHIGSQEFMRMNGNPHGKSETKMALELPIVVPFKYDLDIFYPRLGTVSLGFNKPGERSVSSVEGGSTDECNLYDTLETVGGIDSWTDLELDEYVERCISRITSEGADKLAEVTRDSLTWTLSGVGSLQGLSDLVKLKFGEVIKNLEPVYTQELHGDVKGVIAPSLTNFTIFPLEQTIAVKGGLQFDVVPANDDLVWTLQDASRKQLGNLTPEGYYTAPDASLIEGLFMQVRVTATDKTTGHHSSALVTVLRDPLIVNPLIDSTSGLTRKIKAGVVGDANQSLTWSIKKTGTEGSLDTTTGNTVTYTPSKDFGTDPDVIFVVDEVTVSNGEESATSYIVNRKSEPVNVIAYTVNGRR
ncbi:MAG: hypothetical protein LBF06_11335 [Pseudomonas sp.]|jgi:hypothetical protein|nr:hypothetical protein [Pseudomonas sp.]